MLKKIGDRIWINTESIEEISSGFTEIEIKESEIETIDLEVETKIEKIKEKLSEEFEIVVKVSEEKELEDGGLELVEVEKTIKVKLCDITREEYGDIKLCDKKDKLETAVKELEETVKVVTTETIETEVVKDGYTIVMKSGKEHKVTEQVYTDIVRDEILV